MGHCDSSAQLSGHSEVFGAGGRTAEVAASHRADAGAGVAIAAPAPPRLRARPAASWLLLFLVRVYKIFLSPFFGGACKFYPSCSNYAYEAIARHGARRGTVLAVKRLLRCRPFTKGGFDPVPEDEP